MATQSKFVAACNERGVGNIAVMSSTKSPYTVLVFSKDMPATRTHFINPALARKYYNKLDGVVHLCDNILRATIVRKT